MAEHSLENTVGTALSLAAMFVAAAAYMAARNNGPQSPVLIYDNAAIVAQLEPFTQAGQDPFAVIDAAVAAAVEQGFIIVDTRGEVKGPASAQMQLSDFVRPGSTVGQIGTHDATSGALTLPGTIPAKPAKEAPTARQDAPAPAPNGWETIMKQLADETARYSPATGQGQGGSRP